MQKAQKPKKKKNRFIQFLTQPFQLLCLGEQRLDSNVKKTAKKSASLRSMMNVFNATEQGPQGV